jgi:hypothetical protein
VSSKENADKIIQTLIMGVALNAGIAYVISVLPILGVPPLKQIFTFIFEKLATVLYTELSRFVAFSIIDFENERDLETYQSAVNSLRIVLNTPAENYDHGPDGVNQREIEIEKAKQEYKKRLADLIRFKP